MDQSLIQTIVDYGNSVFKFFDIAIIGIIVLHGILGFFRGSKKSLYFLGCSILVFGVGLIFMNPILEGILVLDLTPLKIKVNGIVVKSILSYGTKLITQTLGLGIDVNTIISGEYTTSFVVGIITFGLRIVYLLLLFILSLTIYKLMFDLIWLKIRPKKDPYTNKRPRKTILSRLGGFCIEGFKGLFLYCLVYLFLISGVLNIANTIKDACDNLAEDTTSTVVSYKKDPLSQIERLAHSNDDSEYIYVDDTTTTDTSFLDSIVSTVESLDPVFDVLEKYDETIPSIAFNAIKIDDKGLDLLLFDTVFSINTKKRTINFRDEIENVVILAADEDVVNAVGMFVNTGFDVANMETYASVARTVLPKLAKSNLVQSVLEVGLEGGCNTLNALAASQSNNYVKIFEQPSVTLSEIDFESNIIGILDIATYVVNQVGDFSNFDFAAFISNPDNDEMIDTVISSVKRLSMFEYVIPYAGNYALNMEELQPTLEQIGLTKQTLAASFSGENISFLDELATVPNVYKKYLEEQEVLKLDEGFTLDNLSQEKIASIKKIFEECKSSVLLQSLLNKSVPSIVKQLLDKQFNCDIDITYLENIDWVSSIDTFFDIADDLVAGGVFTPNPGEDLDIIANLVAFVNDSSSSNTYESFIESLASCDIIGGLLNTILINLNTLGPILGGDETSLLYSLPQLETVNFNKNEYDALFKTLSYGLAFVSTITDGSSDVMVAISNFMDSDDFDMFIDSMSKTKLITNNISPIGDALLESVVPTLLESTGLDLDNVNFSMISNSDVVNWTSVEWGSELSSTFGSLKSILALVNFLGNPTTLSDNLNEEFIDELSTNLSNSKFFVKNSPAITSLIGTFAKTAVPDLTLVGLSLNDTRDWTNTEWKEEYTSIFNSVGVLLSLFTSGDSSQILNVFKADKDTPEYEAFELLIDSLTSSYFLRGNIITVLNYATTLLGDSLPVELNIDVDTFGMLSADEQTNEVKNLFGFINYLLRTLMSGDNPDILINIASMDDDAKEEFYSFLESENSTLIVSILKSVIASLSSNEMITSIGLTLNVNKVESWKDEIEILLELVGSIDSITEDVTNAFSSSVSADVKEVAREHISELISTITESKLLQDSLAGVLNQNLSSFGISVTNEQIENIKEHQYTIDDVEYTGWSGELTIIYQVVDSLLDTNISFDDPDSLLEIKDTLKLAVSGVLTRDIVASKLSETLYTAFGVYISNADINAINASNGWNNEIDIIFDAANVLANPPDDFFNMTAEQSTSLKTTCLNAVTGVIGKKALVGFLNQMITGFGASITDDDISAIEGSNGTGWNKEINCIFDLVSADPMNLTDNDNNLDGEKISSIMSIASEGVIASKILGSVLGSSLQIGVDFTNRSNLLEYSTKVKSIIKMMNLASEPIILATTDEGSAGTISYSEIIDVLTVFKDVSDSTASSEFLTTAITSALGIDFTVSDEMSEQITEIIDSPEFEIIFEEYQQQVIDGIITSPAEFDIDVAKAAIEAQGGDISILEDNDLLKQFGDKIFGWK